MYTNNKSIFTNTNNAPKEVLNKVWILKLMILIMCTYKKIGQFNQQNTTTTRSFAIKFRQSQ